ncbi:hypothetical protein F2P56_028678 [Juglans regia]|uniref:PB1 domain-containing protein n=2 Tax=Juglans regia TaxID=51240 RepID=A0A833TFQ6_JUGRE|nr:uncharacterized protein LOC108988860 [Juglans regia]KAF5448115.1 hypothetical protein F2P56_028678 [Juglans regia]
MGGESEDQGGGGGDNDGVLTVDEMTSSPKNKVKLLCSHGGKILPRTSDGQLKYVGGEIRVITIPRDVSYSELMKKVGAVEFDGEMQIVLKYQVIPEDLDTLVSVRTNEDLKFMLDEYYDRQDQSQGTAGTPRIRVFLFPSNPIIVDNYQLATTASYVNEPGHAILLEQRYVDAINGIIRTTTTTTSTSTNTATAHSKLTSLNASRVAFTISFTCSSPRSNSFPKGQNIDTHDHVNDTNSSTCIFPNGYSYLQNAGQGVTMHKVHSSPSLSSLNNVFQSNHDSNLHGLCNHHFYHHRNYQNHQKYGQHDQQYSYNGNHPRPTNPVPRKATIGSHEMLAKTLSSGRVEYIGTGTGSSLLTGYGLNNYYPSSTYKRDHHHHQGGGGCKMCGHFDECGIFYGCETMGTLLPRSPRKAPLEKRMACMHGRSGSQINGIS